ncbi:enoyl-CoA hydratase/isomerase family protein [Pseudonocardia hispaniensis]|uniref:Enoyl-CoA hydratase/isomerase family protein n=1 Tax=Pseudonocardia hispaniensis TaxID=904933 RepID=A0ABW1J511_9PSEU
MSDAVLLTEPGPGLRLVTLNRPAVRNAMTAELTAAWVDAIEAVRCDDEARVLVVTGAGNTFCAGADLSWLDQGAAGDVTPDRLRDRMLPFYRSWLAPRELAIPVVAAVNGPAIGAGLCLALACDLRYAGPDTVFSAPFIHLGTHGGMGATWLLPEAVGVARARDMLYTGREVGGQRAVEWGLATDVGDDALALALQAAERIARAAPIATRLTKAGLERSVAGLAEALQWEALAQPVTMATADLHEGVQARRERRPPRFTGT